MVAFHECICCLGSGRLLRKLCPLCDGVGGFIESADIEQQHTMGVNSSVNTAVAFKFICSYGNGRVLACKEGVLFTKDFADDECMWLPVGGECGSHVLRSFVGNKTISAVCKQSAESECHYLFHDASDPSSKILFGSDDEAAFFLVDGPHRLPSDHLNELKDTGYTAVRNVIPHDSLRSLKKSIYAAESPDDIEMKALTLCPIVSKAIAHPVVAYLFNEFLGDDIYMGHHPNLLLRPGFSLWHTDYPYQGPGFPKPWYPRTGNPKGLQFNICVDAFREDNAATQFVPGSHAFESYPPRAWNTNPALMRGCPGEGVHQDVRYMIAPAGSGVLYDARTWHRACPECSPRRKGRVAILNAVITRENKPMASVSAMKELVHHYQTSGIPDQLTQRERDVVRSLCLWM